MRHYLTYIACTLAIVFAGSCVKIDINPVEQVPAGDLTTITLQLKSSDLIATRVSVEDGLNENLIKHVQCFFYESDAEPIVVYATDVITITDGETVGKNSTVSDLKITIPSEKMTDLFSDNSCMVYVVANGPVDGISVTEGTTIGYIKANTAVSLNQYEIEGEGDLAVSKAALQTSFIMDGAASVTKNQDTINGTVPLYRVAAKILVKLHVANKIVYDNGTEEDESDDVEWTPLLDQIRIKYINSVTGSKLDAKPGSADPQTLSDYLQQPYDDYKVYKVTPGTTTSECTQSIPFYTYPYDWNSESSKVPSISLLIPWSSGSVTGSVTQTFEYQIPINPTKTAENGTTTETKSLVRNTVYEMTVNVGILGGLTGTVELSPSYIVTDWGTGAIDAELSRPKYLIVDENYVVMNNENTRAVGFKSSDPISVEITKIIKPNFTETLATYPDIIKTDHGFSFSISGTTDGTITLNHELQNDINKEGFDCVPYTVTMQVTMKVGNESFEEIITFIQYPAMYVTCTLNYDYKDDGNTNTNTKDGYVYVNGGTSNYGGVHGLGSAANANPNMYTITTTSFADNKYIIGDPRVMSTNNILNQGNQNWSITAPAINENSNRQIKYYYPTDNSQSTENMIAPKYRIASSYGVTTSGSYDDRRRRCASYQEDGYPAGRWRMPTKAEMEFVVLLSTKNIIPKLFNDENDSAGNDYWSAHGLAEPQSNGTVKLTSGTSGEYSVRCVYDEWYWGSDRACNRDTFTWGDAQRN